MLCCVPAAQVPDALLAEEAVQELMQERRPTLVPLPPHTAPSSSLEEALAASSSGDPAQGVRQLRLSNGVRVNYRVTDNEPRSAMLRLVASGGRAREGAGVGPTGSGVVAVGTRALSESGTVGSWQREQVGLHGAAALHGLS